MNKLLILFTLAFTIPIVGLSASEKGENSVDFDKYFTSKTLRMDYTHAGDYKTEAFYFERLLEEPYFAGSRKNLIDTNFFGNLYLKVFDLESEKLIYSRGFCALFSEWADTDEAKKISRAYRESVVMPYPKNSVRIEIHSRNIKGEFEKKFEYVADPSSLYIARYKHNDPVFEVHYKGNSAHKLDIVLIPEGYTEAEMESFKSACNKFAREMFTYSPFKENSERINIRAVWRASDEHGVTIPGENEWRNTTLGSKFYTLESERYQMVDDFQAVRDVAGNAPYDLIYIISNTQKYGGGGIYNFYGISSANNPESTGKVYVHEFGHLLLGLGDEYEGGASVNDMYPEGVEPWEFNLTRLIDFKNSKKDWYELLDKSLSIPSAPSKLNDNKVGVYEGGGYLNKGIYRPWVNCMMRSLHDSEFCPVCSKGINDMITFICE